MSRMICKHCDGLIIRGGGGDLCGVCADEGVIFKQHESGIGVIVAPNLSSGTCYISMDHYKTQLPTDVGSVDVDEVVDDPHYKGLKIEPNEYIIANDLGWCEGNIVKYATRHQLKGGADDIRKIIRYAELILAEKYS